ncbi:hypothetical protein ACLOJK_007188 [Asimina triloba]
MGLMANPGMPWAFSHKASTLPLPFKGVQDDRPRKFSFDPLTAPAFQSISAIEVFDSAHKISPAVNQKTFNLDRQGPHFAMPAYAVHSIDGHGAMAHRAQEVRAFPVSANPYPATVSHPFLKAHGLQPGMHVAAPAKSAMKQQPLGGVPVATPYSVVPVMGSLAGSYAPRNVLKSLAASAQLTIFYAGAVNVYEDVSPEKAQAIMFLAGQGACVPQTVVNPIAHVASAAPKQIACEGVYLNQSHSNPPCSGLSSPISVTSHPSTHSGTGSSSNEDLLGTKIVGGLGAAASPASQPEPPNIVNALGSAATATMVPTAVPQARKASLARFLEKRKERVMSVSPYNPSRKSPDQKTGFGPDAAGSSAKSSTASNSLMGAKEQQQQQQQAWSLGRPQKHAAADGVNLPTKLEM